VTERIRPVAPDELVAFARVFDGAFGNQGSDTELEGHLAAVEVDRAVAAFDDGAMVGTGGAMSLELTVPGGAMLPVAGITLIGVLPTHRRRGLLTAVMARLLDDARQRGEPVAALHASEAPIYGRFGFGVATTGLTVEVERAHGAFARDLPDHGRLRLVDRDEMAAVLPGVHDAFRRTQPGEVSRPQGWWDIVLRDMERSRDGAGPRFAVVADGPDGPVGYVRYRRRPGRLAGGLPQDELAVEEVIAVTAEAEAALWRYCLDVDLVWRVRADNVALDTPLRWLLGDARRLQVRAMHDLVWVCLLDPAVALTSRTYRVADRMVIEVVGPPVPVLGAPAPPSRWALEAGPGGAECRPTADLADLAVDLADLGSAWMGGTRVATLARAGRVAELRPGAVARADALFTTDRSPWSATSF